jgi:hypothetical protein
MKKTSVILFGILFYLVSCSPPPKKPKKEIQHEKYIILLDLSDRLIKSENQIKRDKEIINYIFSLYYEKVRKSLFIKSKDVFQVVIADQEGMNYSIEFEDILFLDMGQKEHSRKQKKVIDEFSNKLNNSLNLLYSKAYFSNEPNDYKGADIWKYFNDDLTSDLIKSENVKNHIIILTDGYMFVKDIQDEMDNSFPAIDFKSLNNDYNLDVCVLEISPKENMISEVKRLKVVWGNWFLGMGISQLEFLKSNNLSQTKQKLEKFIKRDVNCLDYNIEVSSENKSNNRGKKVSSESFVKNKIQYKEVIIPIEEENEEIYSGIENFIMNKIDKRNMRKDPTYIAMMKSFANNLNSNFPTKRDVLFSLCMNNKELILKELDRFNLTLSKNVKSQFDQF